MSRFWSFFTRPLRRKQGAGAPIVLPPQPPVIPAPTNSISVEVAEGIHLISFATIPPTEGAHDFQITYTGRGGDFGFDLLPIRNEDATQKAESPDEPPQPPKRRRARKASSNDAQSA